MSLYVICENEPFCAFFHKKTVTFGHHCRRFINNQTLLKKPMAIIINIIASQLNINLIVFFITQHRKVKMTILDVCIKC